MSKKQIYEKVKRDIYIKWIYSTLQSQERTMIFDEKNNMAMAPEFKDEKVKNS
jgi:hypothetical protein